MNETKIITFIGLTEAARILGVSRITVRKLLKLREIPYFHVMNQYKIDRDDVLNYLQRTRVNAKHETSPIKES